MASSKQKTTWSKIQRESAKREKRQDKAARKVARRLALEDSGPATTASDESSLESREDEAGQQDSDPGSEAPGADR